MPFEVPEGWVWTTIGSIFLHNTGKALNGSNKEGKLLKYITTSNLYWDRFELNTLKVMRFKDNEIEKCTVRNGDLLVCEGGDIGRAAIWNFEYDIRIQNHIHRLRGLGHISHRLFMYWLIFLKNEGLIGGKGIGLMGLSSRELDRLIVPLPPLREQKKIVDKIDVILEFINSIESKQRELNDCIVAIKTKILDLAIHGKLVPQDPNDEPAIELLKRINPVFKPSDNLHYEGELPAGWQLCHIRDIAKAELGKTLDKAKNQGKEKPYLCALNVKWESFNLSALKTIRIEEKEKARYGLQPYDLLVCEGGDVGRCAIWQNDYEMYYQNALHRVRFKQGFSPDFYLYVLCYYKRTGVIDDICKGVTIKHFTGQVFNSLDLPVPPLNEQKRIVSKVKSLFEILNSITNKMDASYIY